MVAAVPAVGGDGGAERPETPPTGGVVEFEMTPTGAGSGFPTVIPGALPRAAAVPGEFAGEMVSAGIRKSRTFSGVAVSPPVNDAVPGVVYDAGKGGMGPEVAWALALAGEAGAGVGDEGV